MSSHDYTTTNEDFGEINVEFTYEPDHGKCFIDKAWSMVALPSGALIASPFTPLQMKHLEQRCQDDLLDKAQSDLADRMIREAA